MEACGHIFDGGNVVFFQGRLSVFQTDDSENTGQRRQVLEAQTEV